MNQKIKLTGFLTTLLICAAVAISPASAAPSASQQAKISAVFKAIASSNPYQMSKASKNVSSSALLALNMAQNYYATEKYFRSVTTNTARPLNNSPAPAAAGKAKISIGKVVLTTAVPGFSGTYTDFKFNKSGKITSWSIKSTGGSKISLASKMKELPKVNWSLANDIKAIYWGKGMQLDSGVVFEDSLGRKIFQVQMKNVSIGPKSFSATLGKYQSPDRKLYALSAEPVGCFDAGQVVYFTGVVAKEAIVASGIRGILEIPMSNSCDSTQDDSRLEVTIKP